jgi:hypothetical protein
MIDYNSLFSKYGLPKGIVHVGIQFMQIKNTYINFGLKNTIWIESNPFFYDIGLLKVSDDENIFNITIGNRSLLINYSIDNQLNTREIPCYTLDRLFEENNLNKLDYNFLHLGIQGDGEVYFEGIDLNKFKYINIELNENMPKYSKEVNDLLTKLRFKKVEKKVIGNISQTFYVKKRKYNKK